jgi:GNAT superfamily N-acetyltransferase
LSGFRTDEKVYRSRGLYVTPEKRGAGLSKMLLKLTIATAKKENCRIIWTMPRKSALFAYENVGFYKIGKWIDEGVEFGPNCIAINEIL